MAIKLLIISGSLHEIPPQKGGTGVARLLYNVSKNLKGYEVTVMSFNKTRSPSTASGYIKISPDSGKFIFFKFLFSCIPYRLRKKYLGKSSPVFLAYYFSFRRHLKKIRPDIVLTTMHVDAFFYAQQFYPHAHHYFYYRSSSIEGMGEKRLQKLMSKAFGVFTLTRESSESLKRHAQNQANKVYTIPNAVNTAVYSPEYSSSIRNEIRAKYGFGPTDFVFGYAGRMTFSKGIGVLLQSIKQVSKDAPHVKLLIAGDPGYETDKKSVIAIQELFDQLPKNCVQLTGWLDEDHIPGFYSAIDAGILLSKKVEGHSMFGLECQASGKPILLTRIGGNEDIMDDGKTGFLLDCEDFEVQLIARMKLLMEDRALYLELCRGARERMVREHSFELLYSRLQAALV